MIHALFLLLGLGAAYAQEPPAQQQALGAKLLREIADNISCDANVIDLKKQIEELKKQVEKANAEHKP